MSLRARVLWGWGVVIALLLVAGVAVVVTQQHVLVGQVDDRLASVEKLGIKVARAGTTSSEPRFPPGLAGFYVGSLSDGGVLATLATPDDTPGLTPVLADTLVPGVPTTVPATNGSPGGMRIVRYVAGKGVAVVLGAPLDSVHAATTRLIETLALILALCILALGAVLFWVLRLGLEPLERVSRAARAVRAGDTTQRVESFPAGTEAQELGQAFNMLVDANEASELRLRRFVADASHELRTPLATLTGYSSLYAAGGLSDPEALDDAMGRIRQEAGRMQLLVDDLLLLAELDRGPTLALERVDLVPLLAGLVADLQVVAPDRAVSLECPERLPVLADSRRLTQAVAVLTTNAVRHTPTGTAIHVRARAESGRTQIEVIDDGPGIAEPDLPRVFERFYRGDSTRARDTGGSGLGLSIAAAIAHAHQGDIGVRRLHPRGTAFWIDLPSAQARA